MDDPLELVPLLVVRDASRAIDFYVKTLDAQVLARYEHGSERRISHADLGLGDSRFSVTEEARGWNSDAPPSLGGSPVVLQLLVAEVDAVFASMCARGATVVFPVQELLGERMARVRDPFGHLWLLRQRLEELSTEEIQRRRDELFARFAAEGRSKAAVLPRAREEAQTLSGSTGSRQAPRGSPRTARIHLVIGPVGAGKSTFALGLVRDHAAVRLTLDEWMVGLFSPDRPASGFVEWYVERSARCVEQIWKVAERLLGFGTDVVLEIGLLRRSERDAFRSRMDVSGYDSTVYVVDAPRDVRRERVKTRNETRGATFSMVVPPEIFELASDAWEPPDSVECDGRDVRFIGTSAP